MRSGGEGSTLSVWSLETQEFWRARELHVTSSIPSLCWLSRSELVVALGTLDAVGLVNVESGALVRRRGARGVGRGLPGGPFNLGSPRQSPAPAAGSRRAFRRPSALKGVWGWAPA